MNNTCTICHGNGTNGADDAPCLNCGGTGKEEQDTTPDIIEETMKVFTSQDDGLLTLGKYDHDELRQAFITIHQQGVLSERERLKTTMETLLLGVQPLPEDADSFMGELEQAVVGAGYMVKEWAMQAFEEPTATH